MCFFLFFFNVSLAVCNSVGGGGVIGCSNREGGGGGRDSKVIIKGQKKKGLRLSSSFTFAHVIRSRFWFQPRREVGVQGWVAGGH